MSTLWNYMFHLLETTKDFRLFKICRPAGFKNNKCKYICLNVCLRYGGLVVLLQTSPESANIFVLLQRIFRKQTPAQLEQVATAAGLSSEEYQVHGLAVSLPFHFFLKQAFIHKRLQPYKNVSSMFCRLWYSGLSGVCSRSVCKHGQLQVFWRHKVHPKSA